MDEEMNLSKEQEAPLSSWVDAPHATGAAYARALFQLGMQSCFSLLMKLADL